MSEEIAAMYHLTCLSRGIVPERIILRRTVSHCQKETEDNQATVKPEETPAEDSESQSESPKGEQSEVETTVGDQDQAAALAKTSEKNKLEISKLKPNIAETSVVALVQVSPTSLLQAADCRPLLRFSS